MHKEISLSALCEGYKMNIVHSCECLHLHGIHKEKPYGDRLTIPSIIHPGSLQSWRLTQNIWTVTIAKTLWALAFQNPLKQTVYWTQKLKLLHSRYQTFKMHLQVMEQQRKKGKIKTDFSTVLKNSNANITSLPHICSRMTYCALRITTSDQVYMYHVSLSL
jgi:hypothetical protein